MDYCLAYAERAYQHGFESFVVLGGDNWSVRHGVSNTPGSFS